MSSLFIGCYVREQTLREKKIGRLVLEMFYIHRVHEQTKTMTENWQRAQKYTA